jgi:hypothetical protein
MHPRHVACAVPNNARLCTRLQIQSMYAGMQDNIVDRAQPAPMAPEQSCPAMHPHCAGGGRPSLLVLGCCGLGMLPNDELRASPPVELLRLTPPALAAAAPAAPAASSAPAPAAADARVRRLADSPPCCGCCCGGASGDSRPAPLLPLGVPNPITTLPLSPACTGLSPARTPAAEPPACPRKLLSPPPPPPPKLAASRPPPGVDDM